MTENGYQVGYAIRRLRLEHGLGQEDLAFKVGISQPYVSRIENGYIPSSSVLKRIAEGLGGRLVINYGSDMELVYEIM